MYLTWPFLIVVVAVLPWLAWASRRALARQPAEALAPEPRALALQVLVLQAIVFALAWVAHYGAGLTVSWGSRVSASNVGAGVAVVGLALLLAWAEARNADPRQRIPVTMRSALWPAAMVAAAVAEEFAYRGVLTGLLERHVSLPVAAAVSALAFALGHLAQGLRGALASFVFALAMQWLVSLSGGLALAIGVHLAYDLGAAALSDRLRAARADATGQRDGGEST